MPSPGRPAPRSHRGCGRHAAVIARRAFGRRFFVQPVKGIQRVKRFGNDNRRNIKHHVPGCRLGEEFPSRCRLRGRFVRKKPEQDIGIEQIAGSAHFKPLRAASKTIARRAPCFSSRMSSAARLWRHPIGGRLAMAATPFAWESGLKGTASPLGGYARAQSLQGGQRPPVLPEQRGGGLPWQAMP